MATVTTLDIVYPLLLLRPEDDTFFYLALIALIQY